MNINLAATLLQDKFESKLQLHERPINYINKLRNIEKYTEERVFNFVVYDVNNEMYIKDDVKINVYIRYI